mmetsp:Transcript_24450/g.62195  ORF Transcript_24450/g.62195 Transcript_24450/m.62195 type:complete len:183 (-) Transcript_24450:4-552(-)
MGGGPEHVEEGGSDELAKVNPGTHRYPCCIVWTPIPVITMVLPFIGHTGIGDSDGVIHDWGGGPCGKDNMMFGWPTRYLPLSLSEVEAPASTRREAWDQAVAQASDEFGEKMHCVGCGSDCHSHVATALSYMRYRGSGWWDKVTLAAWIFFYGRPVSMLGLVYQFFGLVILAIFLVVRYSSA